MATAVPMMETYIPSGRVAKMLGVKTQTLAKWRMKGLDPKGAVTASSTRVIYPLSSVLDYIEAVKQQTVLFNLKPFERKH